jgi:hypothetical protein
MHNFVHNVLPKYQAGSLQFLGDIAEKGMEAEIENERAVVVNREGVEMDMNDDSVKQKFCVEPDVSLTPTPPSSPKPLGKDDESPNEGYWEVEDVWGEDGWLRGDGEAGMESLRCKRGILPLQSMEIIRHSLTKNSDDDYFSPGVSWSSLSSPSTPVPATFSRGLEDQEDGYFMELSQTTGRSKSTPDLPNFFNTSNRNPSWDNHPTPSSISSFPSPSIQTPGKSRPVTPPSTPVLDMDSSLASRLYALPSWMLAPSRNEGGTKFARLKNRITSTSRSSPVAPLATCTKYSNSPVGAAVFSSPRVDAPSTSDT